MPRNRIIKSGEIGAAIKRRRNELGYSQEWLAEFLDVSYQQVQRYENGISMINVETLQKIAGALSVPATFFFNTERPHVAAEPSLPYQSADEKALLKHYRQIPAKSDRELVVRVARLASRK
ncbi:helix-turn-helix domain-containing protein [Geobacter sp. DSM 9736]|uniref:helix-turn-helix domain-containing protein n=1 Tax=Geobacter sp. DSM 9736 TaxID=1277350 RepID=UPI000B51225E|nr:helix-turn-helix transcriptional regulator [Geobacter sp. DSM 9736]SNB46500.1 Helix-turn-helix [Geobacter sp. DSM 9736]